MLIAPRARDSGYRHVEVDLDRQVLLLTDDEGAVTKILPVSTGSNKRYNEKGIRGLAYTPTGRFRIYCEDLRLEKIAPWITLLSQLFQRRPRNSRKSFRP